VSASAAVLLDPPARLLFKQFGTLGEEGPIALDVNRRDAAGRTPLMNCISNGLYHYITQLAALNADVNAVSHSGESALSLAIASANYHTIEELAKIEGVDTEIMIGELGRTPLHHSIMSDNDNALVKLIEMKANLNAQVSV
jgi:ankyrin repeat protein